MGRPLNKKYMGNRNIGTNRPTDDGIGGSEVASVTLGGTNNSSGFTAGSSQISFSAPQIANGTTTTGALVVTSGIVSSSTTYTTLTGTAITGTQGGTGLAVKSTSGTGTGATFTIAKTGAGTTYSGATTITVVAGGSGYAVGDTITISGALLGGATPANDLTFTLATSVVNGRITGVTITNPGSGYRTVPTVTVTTGTKGTLTLTAVFATDTGGVGSSTYQENAILAWAYTGGNLVEVDLQKQISTKRYRFNKSGEVNRLGTEIGRIRYDAVADGTAGYTAAEGVELNIVAVDASGGTYLVRKLYNRTCTVNPVSIASTPAAAFGVSASSAGSVYTANKQYKWTFGTPTADTVQILNA
jgi:hypothetical protein